MTTKDGYATHPADSKKVDTSELTRDDSTVVERERVVIGDEKELNAFAGVSGETDRGELKVGGTMLEYLQSIDYTLHQILYLLQIALEE